jgi:hypothetical protein
MEEKRMKKPTLVIMAAGMGSRYGGLKQMDPMDEYGHLIMDFSIYDAVQAGFGRVVIIIKRESLQDFRECIGNRIEQYVEVEYVFQELALPAGYQVPKGRVKPFGTGHAVLSCKDVIDGPFVVINADDYYGKQAFARMYEFLTTHHDDEKYHYAMAGYQIENTLSESGSVARGVCELKQEQDGAYLQGITERTCIEPQGDGAAWSEDGGQTWHALAAGTTVSMNFWGFSESLLPELEKRFLAFLDESLAKNPLKGEFFLPFAVNELLEEGKADVCVLPTSDKWYGVTYKEDKAHVVEAIRQMKEQGLYPQGLWKQI